VPLQYPPHVIALSSLYVAALLSSFEQPHPDPNGDAPTTTGSTSSHSAHELAATLGQSGEWEARYHVWAEDIDGAVFSFFLIMLAATDVLNV
jgi:CTD kinase subunit beta